MSIAKKLAGGGSAFSSLSAARNGDTASAEARSEALGRARKASSIPLADIVYNPRNPRRTYSEEAIDETAASMREIGQTTAVTVVSRTAFLEAHPEVDVELLGDASFVALDGNRRLRAAGRAGLEKIRVDLQDHLAATASVMLEAALVANIHRENVPPVEEAEAIRDLLDSVYGGNQTAVARRLGKSPAWVGQRLALLHLAPEVKEMVENKEIGVKEARRLGAAVRAGTLSPEAQVAQAREVRDTPRSVVARPHGESRVNPVYTGVGGDGRGASGAGAVESAGTGRTPQEAGGLSDGSGMGLTRGVAAAPAGSGVVTLIGDPADPEGFARSIRAAMTGRQAAAISAVLVDLLAAEYGAGPVSEFV